MAASSQSSVFSVTAKIDAGATLPLVKYDCCRWRAVIRLVSKSDENPGRVFFKRPNHKKKGSKPGDGMCNFYFWIEAYMEMLLNIGVEVTPLELDLVAMAAAEQDKVEELGPLTMAAISALPKQRSRLQDSVMYERRKQTRCGCVQVKADMFP